MQRFIPLAAVLSVVVCPAVNAASLRIQPIVSPRNIYSLYFNGGADNGNFDTIIVDISPGPGTQLLNPNSGIETGVGPRPAGQAFTYINRMINASPDDVVGGLGWTVLGLPPVAEIANGLEFTAGPLGGTIDTSAMAGGELFIANFQFGVGAHAFVNFQAVSAGTVVYTQSFVIPDPEPATVSLAGLAVLAFAAVRRRSA
jgi:hypothetical protein